MKNKPRTKGLQVWLILIISLLLHHSEVDHSLSDIDHIFVCQKCEVRIVYCLISVAGKDVMLLISLLNSCHCVLQRQLPVGGSYIVFHDVWIKAVMGLIVLLVINLFLCKENYYFTKRIITYTSVYIVYHFEGKQYKSFSLWYWEMKMLFNENCSGFVFFWDWE